MAEAFSIDPFLKRDTGRNTRVLLRLIILCTIAAAAVASRLFSVISESAHTFEETECVTPITDRLCD